MWFWNYPKQNFKVLEGLAQLLKKFQKRIKKKTNSTHCRAIKVVFLFVSKNGFWGIKKQICFSFYGVFLKLSKLEFQSTWRIDTIAKNTRVGRWNESKFCNSLCIVGIQNFEFCFWFHATKDIVSFFVKYFLSRALRILSKVLYTLVLNHDLFCFFHGFLNPHLWAITFLHCLLIGKMLFFWPFLFFRFLWNHTVNGTFNWCQNR